MTYTNSSLVNHTRLSPNHSGLRDHCIDTITIHCVVGQCSVESLGSVFADPDRGASSNYGIGYDGRIGMYVEEKNRSWCSSSSSNDNRAVTIEVASDMTEPLAVTDAAYKSLIKLVADICKRNGIKKLVWSTNRNERMNHLNGCNMTVHRDYANKSCPGTWLYERHGQIAAEVNKLLGAADRQESTNAAKTTVTKTSVGSSAPSKTTTVDDKTKFLNTARSYIGKNGAYVCKTKLGLKYVVDWCAYSVSAIMKDCGFIGKYQGDIYSYASDNARNDNGKYGTWFLKGSKSPQAGDLIMFKYASFTNPIDKYSASHVGIIESVNGNTITTLEGNVDGNNANWAETSTFKRKTRYLSSSDVYSFFRFNWKPNTTSSNSNTKTTTAQTTTNSSKTSTNIDVNYRVYANSKWLPTVKNTSDYAGIENKPIYGVYAKPTKGHIKYRVKLIGGTWLPWVQDMNDFAGSTNLNKQIDCIQMAFTGVSGYSVEYRVSTANSNGYLPWVKNYDNTNEDGYAGIKGVSIDKLQIRIVKN